MAISLPDARELSDEVLEALRVRALRGCELGFPETDMAELLGVSRETVCRWWTAYVAGGLEALPQARTGRPVGSGRLFSDAQAQRIEQLLRSHHPDDLGIHAPLWTRRAVAELIRRQCQVDVPVRTVGLYLRRWGFTPKRPRRHSRKQDPEEVRQWLEETYPVIEVRAAAEAPPSTGPMMSASQLTSSPRGATRPGASRRRRKCPTATSAPARSRRSATKGMSGS